MADLSIQPHDLLARHVAPLQAAYADWIALQPVAERDGWVCLAGQRPRT